MFQYARSEVMLTFFERSPLDQVLRNDNVHRIQPCFQSPIKISGREQPWHIEWPDIFYKWQEMPLISTMNINACLGSLKCHTVGRHAFQMHILCSVLQRSCGLMASAWPTRRPSCLMKVSFRTKRDPPLPTLQNNSKRTTLLV